MLSPYRLTWFPLLCLSLGACAHSSDHLDLALQGWLGQSTDVFVEYWGAPQASYQQESGAKVLTYELTETSQRSFGYWRRTEFFTQSETCRLHFVSSTDGRRIERYQWTGQSASCWSLIPQKMPDYQARSKDAQGK